ncbi:ABC transporter permease [Streptomyces sp. NPDC048172]|uniref:ABC transporter permease n=1 Tax=Streptomyces sp. NPDC048172 TaxID=3365505 RepID=UPI0037185718
MSTTAQTLRPDDGSGSGPGTGTGTSGLPGRRTRARGLGLGPGGMAWLVWRQHRTAFLLLLAAAAVATAGIAWLAHDASAAVAAAEGPGEPSPAAGAVLDEAYQRLNSVGMALAGLPVVIGVFIGAPLFAGDLETGTAKFVGVQSHGRRSWVVTKLGMAALFTALAALSTGIAMKALLTPLARHMAINANFTDAGGFDTTGPVTVALALLGLLIGAAAGLLTRRTLPAMVVTFVALLAVKTVWSWLRMAFAPTVTETTGGGRFGEDDTPQIPASGVEVDTSYVTGDGTLHGWSTCTRADDASACLRREGVVGWSVEYLPFSHLGAMQWAATGALAGLLLLTVGVLAYAARRALR